MRCPNEKLHADCGNGSSRSITVADFLISPIAAEPSAGDFGTSLPQVWIVRQTILANRVAQQSLGQPDLLKLNLIVTELAQS